MEISKRITQFILSPTDYSTGLKLFKEAKPKSPLLRLLENEDDFSRTKLISELQVILNSLPKEKKEPTFKSYTKSKLAGSIDPDKLPEDLRLDYFKLSPYIREIAHHHSQLKIVVTDEERLTRALRIHELTGLRRSIFTRCDYFMEHGYELPVPSAKKEVTQKPQDSKEILEAKAELILKRSMRSKLKKNPRRLKDYVATCERIDQLQAIINGTHEAAE